MKTDNLIEKQQKEHNVALVDYEDDCNKLCKFINNLYENVDKNVIKLLNKNNKKKHRKGKITYNDVLLYRFLYSFIHTSKQEVVSNLNFSENDFIIDRTTYYKKELKIPLEIYKNIFYESRNYYYKNLKDDDHPNLIAVDGTYNNTNINNIKEDLETSLNMGYFDVYECIPIDISFCKEENKNKEVLQLKKYIKEDNLNNLKNIIIVADRAYFSYELMDFLENHGFKYVIRIRNNCIHLKKKIIDDDKKETNQEASKKKRNNKKNNDKKFRIITYKDDANITKKDKDGKDVNLIQTIECNIITNLETDKYNDEALKKIYKSRWSIEVFFKLLKSNFKFSFINEFIKGSPLLSEIQYNKLYYSILSIIYIMHMIDKINERYNIKINKINEKYSDKSKNKKDANSKKNKNIYEFKTNKTLLLKGVKEHLLKCAIKGLLNKNLILDLSLCYIVKLSSILNVYKPRESRRPHTKWYVQAYASKYRFIEIIEALKTKDKTSLNKNLKVMLNNFKLLEEPKPA